jgi:hypothetical protein
LSEELFFLAVKLNENDRRIGWEEFKKDNNSYEIKNKESKYINRMLYLPKVSEKMTKKLDSKVVVYQYQVINSAGILERTRFYLKSDFGYHVDVFLGKNSIEIESSNIDDIEVEKYLLELLCEFTDLRVLAITGNLKIQTRNPLKIQMKFE